jgi:HEAT repeat protein
MLRRALRDSDNRVVGNAVYGIYRISPAESIPLVEEMAVDPAAGRRITAAWVMGLTEDWKFHSLLQKMMKDDEARVRSMALKSMFRVKRARDAAAASQTEQSPAGQSASLAVSSQPESR